MEVAGLVIGVVGLAALYEQALAKIHSVKHFSSESLRITSRYNATKKLFEIWGKEVGIKEGSDLKLQVDDEATVAVVADLLKAIRDVFDTANSDINRYYDQGPLGSSSSKDRSNWTKLRSRVKWSAEDYGKLSRQVQDFDDFVQKLYLLVPVQNLQFDQFQKMHDEFVQSQRAHALEVALGWLDVTPTDSFDAYCSARLDTTCTWITTHPTYTDWLSDRTPDTAKVLWIHGGAGYGKSVLCAYITKLFQDSDQTTVYHHFCSAENEARRDPISILRSWIAQAVYRNENALDAVHQHLTGCETSEASHSDLWHILQGVLSDSDALFVIDGLDECPRTPTSRANLHRNREDVLHKLLELLAGSKARLLVVSRDEGDIEAELGPHGPCRSGLKRYSLPLTKDLVASDTSQFAEHVVLEKLPQKTAEFQKELAARMADKSDGMFLLIRLQSRNLRPRKGNKQLQRIVDDTPDDIVRIYERDWADIQAFSPSDRQRAKAILRWVTFSRRPLTVTQLSEAVSVLDNDDDEPQFDELPDPFDERYVAAEILGLCGCFLELRPGTVSTAWDRQTVHFIHASAIEFLQSEQSGGPFADKVLQEHYLAVDCLRYLDCEQTWQDEKDNRGIICQRPFALYATQWWQFHVRDSFHYRDRTQEQILSFFGASNSNWSHWRDKFEATLPIDDDAESDTEYDASGDDKIESQPIPGGRMYYAAALGLCEVIMHLHDQGIADVNELRGAGHGPLFVAGYYEHLDVLALLLELGANVDERTSSGETLLSLMASINRARVCRVLLEAGASTDVTASDGETPLHFAAYKGSQELCQLLLEFGASPAAADKNGYTPLHYAAISGHSSIVRTLIASGADPNFREREDVAAPLHMAAAKGHSEAARVLLDSGADIAMSVNGATVLHLAVLRGHYATVKLVLDRGADPAVSRNDGFTPLHIAAERGNIEILELLLDSGASTSESDWYEMTPLYVAAAEDHVEVVQLLIKAGAEVDSPDYEGMTPLHAAFYYEQENAIQILLDNQAATDCLDDYLLVPWQYASDKLRATIPNFSDNKIPNKDVLRSRTLHIVTYLAEITWGSPVHMLSSRTLNLLGQFFLLFSDIPSARSVYNQTVTHSTSSDGLTHVHTFRCDCCRADIVGVRHVCTVCAFCNLCASCMERYTESSTADPVKSHTSHEICTGHEFLRVPSDDWDSTAEHTEVTVQELADRLLELAARFNQDL